MTQEDSTVSLAQAVFTREPSDPRVIVADGFGITVSVDKGHLVVTDGIGKARRTRRFPRIERTVKRLVIMGDTGYITFEAFTWCAHLDISIVQLDRTGKTVAASTADHPDARLIRAQAFVGESGPHIEYGISVVKNILHAKLTGQARIARDTLGNEAVSSTILEYGALIEQGNNVNDIRGWEAAAAASYWSAWAGLPLPWRMTSLHEVPEHWLTFNGRITNVTRGSNRNAADPANAMLNYAYRLAETECRMALVSVGLDPSLGILHLDEQGRDSFALDIIEVVRPTVEQFVLGILDATPPVKYLSRLWFHEMPDGRCRLVAPLTHVIAEQMPAWARVIAPVVDQVARIIATVGKGDVRAAKVLGKGVLVKPRSRRGPVMGSVIGLATVTQLIPDSLWTTVEQLIPDDTSRADNRAVLAGIVCVEILGSSWAQIPATLGTNRWTCKARLDAWNASGVWEGVRDVVAREPHIVEMVNA